MAEDLPFELLGFGGRRLDPLSECAQHELRRQLVDGERARAAEAAAALEQTPLGERLQLTAKLIRSGHDHAAQLHERPPADLDRAAASEEQQPQGLASLPLPRHGQRLAHECCSCCTDRVERVVLALQPPLVARAAAALEHRLAATAQVTNEARAVMASPFNRPDMDTSACSLAKRSASA